MNGPQSVFREADAEYDCPFVMGSENKEKKKKKKNFKNQKFQKKLKILPSSIGECVIVGIQIQFSSH